MTCDKGEKLETGIGQTPSVRLWVSSTLSVLVRGPLLPPWRPSCCAGLPSSSAQPQSTLPSSHPRTPAHPWSTKMTTGVTPKPPQKPTKLPSTKSARVRWRKSLSRTNRISPSPHKRSLLKPTNDHYLLLQVSLSTPPPLQSGPRMREACKVCLWSVSQNLPRSPPLVKMHQRPWTSNGSLLPPVHHAHPRHLTTRV